MREDRPADKDVIVIDDHPVERDRHILLQAAEAELFDHGRRDRAQVGERGRIFPSVIEDAAVTGAAIDDRAADVLAQLLVAHRRVGAERDEEVERGNARRQLALQDLEHQRHRHRPRPVRYEDDDAFAVERKLLQTLPSEVRHLFLREIAVDDAATDNAHRDEDAAAANVLYSRSIASAVAALSRIRTR